MMAMFFITGDRILSEYSAAFYGTSSSAMTVFLLGTFIWKTDKVYDLMENFEEIIEKRKCLELNVHFHYSERIPVFNIYSLRIVHASINYLDR